MARALYAKGFISWYLFEEVIDNLLNETGKCKAEKLVTEVERAIKIFPERCSEFYEILQREDFSELRKRLPKNVLRDSLKYSSHVVLNQLPIQESTSSGPSYPSALQVCNSPASPRPSYPFESPISDGLSIVMAVQESLTTEAVEKPVINVSAKQIPEAVHDSRKSLTDVTTFKEVGQPFCRLQLL